MNSSDILPETPNASQNSENIDFYETNWNCVTSEAFLKHYLRHLLREADKTSLGPKPMNLVCENPGSDELQLSSIIEGNTWRINLCKCCWCLQMYQNYNVEYLFLIKNIECLPPEFIITLFTYLPSSDRRVASECCKLFHAVWLRDIFIDDRRVVFDKCVLHPQRDPCLTFSQSDRNYRCLVLGEIKIYQTCRKLFQFPENLKETVTTIELKKPFMRHIPSNISSILSQFPNLKTIKVENMSLPEYFPELPSNIEIVKKELATNTQKLQCLIHDSLYAPVPVMHLSNLSRLTITYIKFSPEWIETWPVMIHLRKLSFQMQVKTGDTHSVKIFEKMPGLEDLFLNEFKIYVDPVLFFETLAKSMKRLKRIMFNSSSWNGIENDDYCKVVGVLATNCKYLKHIFTHRPRTAEIMRPLLQKYPSIRTLEGVWLK